MAETEVPRWSWIPNARCASAKNSDVGGDTARPMTRAATSTTCTTRQLDAALAENSRPMKPAPMTTTLLADARSLFNLWAAQRLCNVWTPANSCPANGRRFGIAPVASTRCEYERDDPSSNTTALSGRSMEDTLRSRRSSICRSLKNPGPLKRMFSAEASPFRNAFHNGARR